MTTTRTRAQPGPWLFAAGLIGLGLTQAIFQTCLPGLKPLPEGWTPHPVAAVATGLLLAGGAAALLLPRLRPVAGLMLAAFWGLWLAVGHAPRLMAGPTDPTLWVAAAEVATLALVALAIGRGRPWALARIALGLTVLLFGAVHALYPAAIASLIPGWIPAPALWPWITAAIQIVAGLAILLNARTAITAFVVGGMWLAWIPLVHLGRVAAAPGDLFEWTFLLTALTLAGAAWSVGEGSGSRITRELTVLKLRHFVLWSQP